MIPCVPYGQNQLGSLVIPYTGQVLPPQQLIHAKTKGPHKRGHSRHAKIIPTGGTNFSRRPPPVETDRHATAPSKPPHTSPRSRSSTRNLHLSQHRIGECVAYAYVAMSPKSTPVDTFVCAASANGRDAQYAEPGARPSGYTPQISEQTAPPTRLYALHRTIIVEGGGGAAADTATTEGASVATTAAGAGAGAEAVTPPGDPPKLAMTVVTTPPKANGTELNQKGTTGATESELPKHPAERLSLLQRM